MDVLSSPAQISNVPTRDGILREAPTLQVAVISIGVPPGLVMTASPEASSASAAQLGSAGAKTSMPSTKLDNTGGLWRFNQANPGEMLST